MCGSATLLALNTGRSSLTTLRIHNGLLKLKWLMTHMSPILVHRSWFTSRGTVAFGAVVTIIKSPLVTHIELGFFTVCDMTGGKNDLHPGVLL